MIEYYSGLMREAEQREALALWRVRRLRLDGRRKQFLLSQQDNITAELETNPLPSKVGFYNDTKYNSTSKFWILSSILHKAIHN